LTTKQKDNTSKQSKPTFQEKPTKKRSNNDSFYAERTQTKKECERNKGMSSSKNKKFGKDGG